MSVLLPDPKQVQKDVITSFCHFVHFFPSRQAADRPGYFHCDRATALVRHVAGMLLPGAPGDQGRPYDRPASRMMHFGRLVLSLPATANRPSKLNATRPINAVIRDVHVFRCRPPTSRTAKAGRLTRDFPRRSQERADTRL